MSWIAAGIAGGSALIKGVTGIVQNNKANAIDKANPFPNMPVQAEYQQNVNQAQNMTQTGIPQQAYNNSTNAINRNQAAGLAAISRSANPGSGVTSAIRQANDATGNLNAQDALARNRNMLQLLQERRQLAAQKDKAWDWNHQQRYLGNLAKANSLRGSANTNINGAFNDAGGLAVASLYSNGGFGGGAGGYVNPRGADIGSGGFAGIPQQQLYNTTL